MCVCIYIYIYIYIYCIEVVMLRVKCVEEHQGVSHRVPKLAIPLARF